jgi:hypothetical protein
MMMRINLAFHLENIHCQLIMSPSLVVLRVSPSPSDFYQMMPSWATIVDDAIPSPPMRSEPIQTESDTS